MGSVEQFCHVLVVSTCLFEGVNRAKKHKSQIHKGVAGGIVEKTRRIHISNVALFNPVSKRADRTLLRFGRWSQSSCSSRTVNWLVRRVMMARLQAFYKETVVAELTKQFGYKSTMEVPELLKSP